MTEIRIGQVYLAKEVKVGRNKSGPWEIIIVQAPGKNQPKIAISVIKPPSGIGPNGVFKITSIRSVMHRNWKSNGRWLPGSVTVRCGVKSLARLSDKEMERLQGEQQINYNSHKPKFPSLEDMFK